MLPKLLGLPQYTEEEEEKEGIWGGGTIPKLHCHHQKLRWAVMLAVLMSVTCSYQFCQP